MKVFCKYYSNNFRLAAGITGFSDSPSFRFFCLEGTIVRNKSQFTVITECVTVLVSCISRERKKNLMVVLTSNPKYRGYDGNPIETDDIETSSIYFPLALLLREKYMLSHNPFTLEFSSSDGRVFLSMLGENGDTSEHGSLSCRISGTAGEVILMGDEATQPVLDKCKEMKAFEFTCVTPDVEKTISVKRSRGEILREIAHYLSKTLVLVSFLSEGQLLEQYISPTTILQCQTKTDGSRFFKKISPSVLKASQPFCVYATSTTIEDICREQGKNLKRN